MTFRSERVWLAMALLFLLASVALRPSFLSPLPLPDEEAYVCAARALNEGRALADCPRFLYGEASARAVAAVWALGGPGGLLALLRVAVGAGVVWTLWLSLGRWPLRVKTVLAAVALVAWPPATQALEVGNLSAATAALTLSALVVHRTRALAAGVLLGLAIAVKPLAAAVPLVLLGYAAGQFWRARQYRVPELVCSVVAVGVAALLGFLGGGFAAPPSPQLSAENPITLVRLFHQLGLDFSVAGCFALAVALGAALAASARFPRLFVGELALVISLLAAPLVWNHSFLLVGPVVFGAVGHAVERSRLAASGSQRQRALLAVLGTTAGALFIALSDDIGAFSAGPLGAALLALPLLSPAALLSYLALDRGSQSQRTGVPGGA